MKKSIALFFVLSMLFVLNACGGNVESIPVDEGTEEITSTTENTNDQIDGTEDSIQGMSDGAAGGNTTDTTEQPTIISPTIKLPTTHTSTTTSPATIPSTTATPHTHSYNSEVTIAATCEKDGLKTFTCDCGSTYTEKIVATGQHSWKSATCTSPKICTTCNTTEGSAAGHSWGNWVTVSAAGVGKTGQEKRTCSLCKQFEMQTIPALQEDTTKKWFINQYNIAKQQYISTLDGLISNKRDEISSLEKQAKDCYTEYMQEIARIKEQCARNGLSNSGYEAELLKRAEDNYMAKASAYTNQIKRLEDEISALNAEISRPNVDNILAIVAQNCNISSQETYAYYYKYSDSIR